MKPYYISRGVLSLVIGLLGYLVSGLLWLGALITAVIFITFVLLVRSGRYKVKPERGVTALQRDEWTRSINDKAGRNAWAVVALGGSLAILYYGLLTPGDVPLSVLAALIFSGMLVYFATDYWLRRL